MSLDVRCVLHLAVKWEGSASCNQQIETRSIERIEISQTIKRARTSATCLIRRLFLNIFFQSVRHCYQVGGHWDIPADMHQVPNICHFESAA